LAAKRRPSHKGEAAICWRRLAGHDARHVPRLGLFRRGGQDAAIEFLGLGPLPGLILGQRDRQSFAAGGHGV